MINIQNDYCINSIIFIIELLICMISFIGIYSSRNINIFDNIRKIIFILSICDLINLINHIYIFYIKNKFLIYFKYINLLCLIITYNIFFNEYLKLNISNISYIKNTYNILYMIINIRLCTYITINIILIILLLYLIINYIIKKYKSNNDYILINESN
jgi:hypothetical protein